MFKNIQYFREMTIKTSFMNKHKQIGVIMNNFKKIGLTALAGSLVAVSANAIELSVSGTTSVSYTSNTTTTAAAGAQGPGGNAIGVDTGISFSGSGELENGFTVSTFAALDDGRANTLSSSQLTLGMGSLGTVVFAQQFGTAANGIDDMTPRVKEEMWDQAGGSVLQSFGRATAEGAVTYKTPSFDIAGLSISGAVDYDPAANLATDDHDAATAKAADAAGSGTAMVVKIASDMGLTVGAGQEIISGQGADSDKENVTAYATYTMGPISVGYQAYYLNNGTARAGAAASASDYDGEAMSIAFNVNDNLSIGYGEVKETKGTVAGTLNAATTPSTDRDISSLTVAYSAGGMALTVQQTETDNYALAAAASARNTENTHVTLAFAF
jgi:outer membrane protein OmpU